MLLNQSMFLLDMSENISLTETNRILMKHDHKHIKQGGNVYEK